jgi:peptidyl-prolyl cis-trans isomerase C
MRLRPDAPHPAPRARTRRHRLGLAGLALLVLGTSAGCSSCNDKALSTQGGGDGGHRTSTELTPEQQAKVLAKVGDKTITLGDFVASLENMDQFDRLRYQSADRRKELLNEMITVELLAQEARAKGYDKDPLAEQEIRGILRDAMLAEARKNAPSPNDIPEADARGYFEAHKADYRDPERRRLSIVVTKDEASAKEVLAAAEKGLSAAQWGDLVRSKSIDPQAKANVPVDLAGDVGIVSPPGDSRGENTRVADEVRAEVFEIAKPGDVLARPIPVKGKYYVVRLTQKIEPHERPFEESERTIRIKLAQDRARAKEEELIAGLKKQYPVAIDEAALSTVHVDLADAGSYANTPEPSSRPAPSQEAPPVRDR